MITLLFTILAAGAFTVGWRDRRELSKSTRRTVIGFTIICVAGALWTAWQPYLFAKTLGRLAMPTGLIFVVLFVAPFVAVHRFQHRAAAALAGLWLVFSLAGNEFIGGVMLGALESEYYGESHPLDVDESFDAVMVLGGGSGGSSTHYFVSSSGDRIVTGARLFHEGKTPVLITSGSAPPDSSIAHDSAAATTAVWTDLAIPEDAIVRVPQPHNTREEIAALARLADENGWSSVGLVTSAWHLRRAMKLVAKADLSSVVTPIPSDYRGSARWDGIYSVIPTGTGFHRVHRASWEFLGAAVGR